MIFPGLVGIIIIIAIIVFAILFSLCFDEVFFISLFSIVAYAISLAIGAIIITGNKISDLTVTVPIASLKHTSSVSGSFFLGSGSINGVMKYYTYIKESDDTYIMQTYDSRYVKIKQVKDLEQPTIEYYDNYTHSDVINILFGVDQYDRIESYIVNVPVGTIVEEFKL